MFKHWKRYLVTFALVAGLAVAPVAVGAQDSTPEPTPIGGEAPSEIPTPGDVTTDLSQSLINLAIAIVGSPILLELIIGLARYLPFLAVLSDDVLKGIVAAILVGIYLLSGLFGFAGQFLSVAGFLQNILPLLLGILSMFSVAPKVRSFAVANSVPVFQQAAKG